MLKRFLNDRSGATAIEYALIGVAISIAIAVVVFALGSQLNTMLTGAANML